MQRRLQGKVDIDRPIAPMSWMQRLKRVFQIDIEACPQCVGNVRVIACIEDPQLIRKILNHVNRDDSHFNKAACGPPHEAVVD